MTSPHPFKGCRIGDDRGATAVIIAAGMVLFLGMAALAVDYGLGVNERRQDQSSADSGVMAGALDAYKGPTGVRDAALEYVRKNLPTEYGVVSDPLDGTWLATWDACVDSGRPSDFVPVPALTGMTNSGIDCISIHPDGTIRVRVPDQFIDAAFAGVFGVNQLSTSAAAEASLSPGGDGGGVLPFGVLASAAGGDTICLRDSSGGQAVPPCDGTDAGNFGMINAPLAGNDELGTPDTCFVVSGPSRFELNVMLGLDHAVFPLNPDATAHHRVDDCTNPLPNRLMVSTGVQAQNLWDAFIDGGSTVVPSAESRLQQGAGPRRTLRDGNTIIELDDTPIWTFLDPSLTYPECSQSLFPPTAPDTTESLMAACFAAAGANQVFTDDIFDTPRFGLIPQFHATAWPTGTSEPRTIRNLAPIFIQGLYYGCTGATCDLVFIPGDGSGDLCIPQGAGCKNLAASQVSQVSAIMLPADSLDMDELYYGPSGLLGPFEPQLSK